MNFSAWGVVLFVLLVLVFMVAVFFLSILGTQKRNRKKILLANLLGMTPISRPDAALAEKISALHRLPGIMTKYELRNVSQRALTDGEMYLFDLVEKRWDQMEEIGTQEEDLSGPTQAVAICSASLRLPPFELSFKSNLLDDIQKISPLLAKQFRQVLDWGESKLGDHPVNFPEFPDFQSRYVVRSTAPESAQRFFDERIARYFADTEYYTLRAAGDLFIFFENESGFDTNDQSLMARRIKRALEIYSLFQG
jgi:hypothetical protein